MNALCLLNHRLTDNQIQELKINWNCNEIIYPPESISLFWAQIPDKDISQDLLQPVVDWVKNVSHSDDLIIVQGEFGATYALVSWCFDHDLIPVHSVTKRVAEEEREGETVFRSYVFKHIRFRKYQEI